MGKKDFKRPPFGTQTPRFNVTGVHPKSKTPGSFTQIPYDKFSVTEQKKPKTVAPNLRKEDVVRLENVDNCLQNIRENFQNTKKQLNEIEELKKKRALKLANNVNRKTAMSLHLKKIFSFLTYPKSDEQTNLKTDVSETIHTPVNSLTTFTRSASVNNFDSAGQLEDGTENKDKEVDGVGSESNDNMTHSGQGLSNTETALISSSCNVSGNAANDAVEENKDETKEEKDKPIVNKEETVQAAHRSRGISFGKETLDSLENKNKNVVGKGNKENIVKDGLSTAIEENTGNASCSVYECADFGYDINDVEQNKKSKGLASLTQGTSDEMMYPIMKKTTSKIREKRIPCDTLLKRKLGPGTYNIMIGGFSATAVDYKASGPGWARQLEVERLAALPHLLYKEQWEENKMLKKKLGPGSYQIKDFIEMSNLKPRSMRGVCENLAPRFEKSITSFTPGPGTYGIGGIPQKAIEEKCQKSMSSKGMLDSGDRKRNLPSVGSHLGPGTYKHKSCTNEMLNKVTSLKGPYELYSGDRNKPISEGYQAAPKLADLGPGQYEIGSFVDDLNSNHKGAHGVFGKMAQYPEVPTERLFLFSQAHCPNKKDIPGPGAYSVQNISKPQAVNSPGFLSSAKRDDKVSQKFFTRNFNPVGAGRYDIQKYQDAQDVNGHCSAFKSKTGKPNLQMAKFLQERIRSKDVPVEERMFISEPERPALSRSVTVM